MTPGPIPGHNAGIMPPFTKENAKQMADRANKARWERERSRKAAAGIAAGSFAPVPGILQDTVARTWYQIQRLDDKLDTLTDCEEIDRISKAKERLFSVLCHAANIPSPGQLKPGKRPAPQLIEIDPVPVLPAPQPADQPQPEAASKESLSAPDPSPLPAPPTPLATAAW